MRLTESVILKRRRNKENMKLYHSIIPCIIVVIANIFLSFAIADEKPEILCRGDIQVLLGA